MFANEVARRPAAEVEAGLDRIADAMTACIDAGCACSGELPGGLGVKRRAPMLSRELVTKYARGIADPLAPLDAINLWAMAVNEENAAGGRVVTAPTNGAAGIIPAVIRYYERLCGGDRAGVRRLLLAAGAIGALYKRNASISGAEVGCQGEVGVACSMAAAGLTAALGGSNGQVENAAEIGMEHNLGLTCDPVARAGAGALHRAQRDRCGQGGQRLAARHDGRRHASGQPGPGDRDDAPDRARHADQVQGNLARRARGERGRMLMDDDRLKDALAALGIGWSIHEHAAVFTVDESEAVHAAMPGLHTKNLFLKDAGGRFWLVTVPHDLRVDLKALAGAIGAKKLSFGKPEALAALLGVTPGSVTPLAALNNAGGEVTVVLDDAVASAATVNVHPLRNTATIALAGGELVRALTAWSHRPLVVAVPVRADPDMMRLEQVTLADVIGLVGVVLYLVAYGGLALGRMSPEGVRYHAFNAAGSVLMIYSLVFRFNLSSFVSQVLWLALTVLGFVRSRRARRR